MLTRILVAFLLLAASCGSADSTDSESSTLGPTAILQSGTWSYTTAILASSTCTDDPVAPGGTFLLQLFSNAVDFSMSGVSCSLNDFTFTCPATPGASELFGQDAAIASTVAFSGTVLTDTSLSGHYVLTRTCSGHDCKLALDLGYTFPCSYTFDFTAAFYDAPAGTDGGTTEGSTDTTGGASGGPGEDVCVELATTGGDVYLLCHAACSGSCPLSPDLMHTAAACLNVPKDLVGASASLCVNPCETDGWCAKGALCIPFEDFGSLCVSPDSQV